MRSLNPKKNNTNLIPLFVIGTFSLHLLTVLVLMFHNTMLQQVKRKTLPETLVQLADGRTIAVAATENLERNEQTIRRFVGEVMTLTLTSSKNLPPRLIEEIISPLIDEELKQKLNSTNSSNNHNIGFNDKLERNSRNTEKVLVIQEISQPEKISNGKWRVNILANSLIFKGAEKTGNSIPFNKQIFVRAIEKNKATPVLSGIPASFAVRGLWEARLEIYNICELKDKKCSTAEKTQK